MRFVITAVLCLFASFVAAQEGSLEDLLRQTAQRIEARDLQSAERLARDAVARHPESRDARMTLAWVTLWNGRYDEARSLFRTLVEESPADAGARLGAAQAAYWSGDLREARRAFEALLQVDPANAEAHRALREIAAASRPGYLAQFDGIRDDQPYRASTFVASYYAFTDPLTKWSVSAATSRSTSDLRDGNGIAAGAGLETTRNRLTTRANATAFRFPDGATRILPRLELQRPAGATTLALIAERRELLRAATALRTHPTATSLAARWSRERPGATQFAVRAETLRYFDDNRGIAADAYLLVPTRVLTVGVSAAWRDTAQTRFDGVRYDPYYTPQKLGEARLVAQRSWEWQRATIALHLDGGIARDELYGLRRTFHPWSGSLSASVPLTQRMTLHVRSEHQSTIYYTADAISTSVAGRF